jgi:hypothetical protein
MTRKQKGRHTGCSQVKDVAKVDRKKKRFERDERQVVLHTWLVGTHREQVEHDVLRQHHPADEEVGEVPAREKQKVNIQLGGVQSDNAERRF